MIDGPPPPEGTTPAEEAPRNMADAFLRFLRGELTEAMIGLWRLSPGSGVNNISLFYQDSAAIYGFKMIEEDDRITMVNFHRNAERGKGTPTLREIERNLTLLAEKSGKKVHVSFGKFKQEDTAVWLTKNGYTYNPSNDSYEKEIG